MQIDSESIEVSQRSKEGKDREVEHKFFIAEAFKREESEQIEDILLDIARKNHK